MVAGASVVTRGIVPAGGDKLVGMFGSGRNGGTQEGRTGVAEQTFVVS